MKPSHHFIADYNYDHEEYKFKEMLPCNAVSQVSTSNGTYYLHSFEYPDAFYYIYCNQVLVGEAKQKLYNDLLAYAPQIQI